MQAERTIGNSKIRLIQGDITRQDVEAIVNAANSSLMGGGGVDGAIHRAGGPQILDECRQVIARIGSLPTGEAVITTGGNLKARHVIHTVGPVWHGGSGNETALLERAYLSSLSLAKDKGIETIAFPSISTGAYRFPIERAATIALSVVIGFLRKNPLREVRFVLFSETDFETYRKALENLPPDSSDSP
jgi:O-acetyl-ADP-ribose deacetylase (regulator of RNase III)